ncbi:hypothetical protein GGF32_000673 [Allomyces javanicus]|nr:hypothetical protein GGF32_000673 [Allomyces javanicus]
MTDRVLKKLKLSLENGDYYGAHQMYLTVCNRYVKGKRITEAVDLLANGARLLCEHKQYGSALDMTNVILKTWTDEHVAVSEDNLTLLFDLLDAFPADGKEIRDLAKHAIKWTAKCGEFASGEPALHHQIGVILAGVDKIEDAQRHFILGTTDSAESLAVLILKEGQKNHFKPENLANMTLTPTLQYLSTLRIAHALTFFATFTKHLVSIDATIKSTTIATAAATSNHLTLYTIPVLNFVQLVIMTAQRGPMAAAGYQTLCQQYLVSVPEHDPLRDLLERVGETVFNIRPRKAQPNFLQDIMASLMGGGQ